MGRETNSFLPRFSVTRPITVLMGLTALLVVGFIAFTQIPVELFPAGFTPKFLGVWTPYPNANPQEVEEQIAKPIEEQIRTISGVRRVETNSFTNGCWTFIEFAKGTDMDVAYAQLRDRVDRVKAELPDDVERLFIRKWSNDDEPILWVSFAQQKPINDVYALAEIHIKKPLERIDGVAKVDIWGAEEKSVLIHVNQNKVKAYKINLYQVIQTLRNDNFAISSGRVIEGGRDIFVRSMGKFLSLEDIRNLPVKGTNILLKDVAEVKYDVPEHRWRNRIDGQAAIGIGVFKESTANTVELCKTLTKKFEEDFANSPQLADFKIQVLFNQGDWIGESVENLERTAMWGGIFAFLILFFFLRRVRMTIIVNVAIPLSLLVTLIFIYFIGWTLNLITMMGLMISIGMVVDNSIVVVENIYRRKAEGMSNLDSAIAGASEVGLAITMATLTTVVVFLPLILMNSNEDFTFFMLRIGMPVVIALISSLAVAMIFIPLGATRITSTRDVKEAKILVVTNKLYQRALKWTMEHRIETFIILLLTIISMQFAMNNTKVNDSSEGNINDVRIFFDMPGNYQLADAERVFNALEDTVRAKKDLYGIRTINSRYSATWGQMRIFLKPPPKKDWYEVVYDNILKNFGVLPDGVMERNDVVEDLKKRFPEFPGVVMRTSWRRSGGEDASVSVMLYGDDTTTLTELSKEVERRLRSIKEIVSVETDQDKGNDEIHLYLKRDQLKKYGITPNVVSGTVQYALRGFPLPKYHTPNKEVDVQIQVREEDRRNLSQLKNLTFFTASGKEIPLDAIADFNITKGLGEIHRENGKTFLQVKANTTKDDMKDIFRKVDLAMAGFAMPYGYRWSKGRNFNRMNEGNESVMFAMLLAVTFVFIIMGILFESFVLPLSVIFSMPFALVGAYWLLYLTQTPIDFMSRIGFVILVGIVVNNAIVLIDLINRLRNEGYDRIEAIIEAGRLRYRPILMTAFTTIGGLIPMAVGNTAMIGIPYAPMGRTIIGGLLLSTLVSLIAVPWAYTVFDDMRTYFRRLSTMYLHKSETVL